MAGVEQARADLRADAVSAVFDPSRTTVEALRAAVEAAGYRPRSVEVRAG